VREFDWIMLTAAPAADIRRAHVHFEARDGSSQRGVRVTRSVGVFLDKPELGAEHPSQTRVATAEKR
jgi:hypothetical protein